jgi:hypothetical protein
MNTLEFESLRAYHFSLITVNVQKEYELELLMNSLTWYWGIQKHQFRTRAKKPKKVNVKLMTLRNAGASTRSPTNIPCNQLHRPFDLDHRPAVLALRTEKGLVLIGGRAFLSSRFEG